MIAITELTMAHSYLFFGVSPRYLFVPYALFLGGVKFIKDKEAFKLPGWNRVVLAVVLIYYLWVLLVQLGVHGYSVFEYRFYRYMGRSFMYVATGFLIQFFAVKKEKLIKFVNVVIVFCGISALVGVGQVIFGGIFLDLRELLQKSPQTVGVCPTNRAFGLQLFHIPFSYDMLMGSFLAFPFLDKIKDRKEIIKKVAWFVVILAGLIFSMTRSAVGGTVAGFLFIGFAYRRKLLVYAAGLGLAMVLIFLGADYLSQESSFERMTRLDDGSASVRRPLFKVGWRIIENNPLGIGNERYEEYVEENSGMFEDIEGWRRATRHGVHNHFLLNTVYFGWPAGFLSVVFYFFLLVFCGKIFFEANSGFVKNMSVASAGFFLAYGVNITFHNAGFFKGEATAWIVIGVLLALNNMNVSTNES